MSCAACHDPAYAFTPPNALPVQLGGADGKTPGRRAVPTLKYLQAVMPFTEHYMGSEDDGALDGVDQGPAGGLAWDGRVDRASQQARIPLLSPFEMANGSPAGVAARAIQAGYGSDLIKLFGPDVLNDPQTTLDAIGETLEAYQQDPATFFPYNSKFDAYLNGQAALTAQEARGLAAFEDKARGNCIECHKDKLLPNGGHPDFTDFGFVALGVPRNQAIPANADPHYFDLGLCGPDRTDLSTHTEYCGMFKAPTLRNVALKKSFFHNGFTHSLRDAVAIYADRDLAPGKWYPHDASGKVRIYDDIPDAFQNNLHREPPLDRKPGSAPALNDSDIDDIVAFLGTLTDGYGPPTPPSAK